MPEHSDYPHTLGTLPDCPACDLEMARQAFVQARRGQCPAEMMEMLDKPHKRLVENAVRAAQAADEEGIPARDALHKLNLSDRQKAQIAAWVCADAVDDWTGGIEHRMTARQAADDRARERVNDDVLAICADLDPEDWSLEARQVRETAASIRDHRANKLNQQAGQARKRERELLVDAQAQFDDKNELIRLRDDAFDQGDMGWMATYRDRAKEADKRGNDLTLEAIKVRQEIQQAEQAMDALLSTNNEYDMARKGRGF